MQCMYNTFSLQIKILTMEYAFLTDSNSKLQYKQCMVMYDTFASRLVRITSECFHSLRPFL
jgi:hypothetical protein